MSVRETVNLLQKDGSYPRAKWVNLYTWLEDLHTKSKTKILFSLPNRRAASNLCENKEFRIDCQGWFELGGHGWYNLQVQENRPRRKNESTTVMTTYVHESGYKRESDPAITSSVIVRVMESQSRHAIPEMTIFVNDESGKGGFSVKDVQRSPHGILEYGNAPYVVWEPQPQASAGARS